MMSKREKDWRKIDSRLIGLGREIGKYFKEMFIIDEEKLRKELEYENKFHIGRPRSMPESVVRLGFIYHAVFGLQWRQTEGLLKEIVGDEFVATYPQIRERSKHYEAEGAKIIKLPGNRGSICIFTDLLKQNDFFIDSTGLSLKRRSLWRSFKFKNPLNQKWVKMHILMNKEGQICALALTNSTVSDSEIFREILRYVPRRSRIYGDKAYFARKNYKMSAERNIEFHSPPKKNARTLAKGVPSYRKEVLMYKKLGYERWAANTGYKQRFNKEYIFARYKAIFGESTNDRTLLPIFSSAILRCSLLNSSLIPKPK